MGHRVIIVLKGDDKAILESIRDTFMRGSVTGPDKNGAVRYAINNVAELNSIAVPFFEKYKLHAKKRLDFSLWKDAVLIFEKNRKNNLKQNFWDDIDKNKLLSIKKEMEVYKGGGRHNWKWLKVQ